MHPKVLTSAKPVFHSALEQSYKVKKPRLNL